MVRFMENTLSKAYAEVDTILSFMEIQFIEKVPKKLRETIKNEKSKEYHPKIDKSIPLDEQNLERKTYAILAMLDLQYWCNTEEEKQELLSMYANNDKKYQEELRQKYNPDNIFPNRTTEKESTSLVVYPKEGWIKRLINRMKKRLKR